MGQHVTRLVTGVTKACSSLIDGRRLENPPWKYEQLPTAQTHERPRSARQASTEKLSGRDAAGVRDMDVDPSDFNNDEETELAEPPELNGPEFDIPEDAYGGAILGIVEYVPRLCRGESVALNLFVSGMSIGLLVINLVLQVAILAYVNGYVVQPAVRKVQVQYEDFRRNVFEADGQFSQDAWDVYDSKAELCEIALTDRTFYYAILLCWTMSMLREARTTNNFIRDIQSMPRTLDSTSMVLIDEESGKTFIIALTTTTRVMLHMLVCCPKAIISVLLLWLGCQWLSATTSFTDLVMNAVAMEFVLTIDNTLYDAFLPVWFRDEVAEVNFKVLKETKEEETPESKEKKKWTGIIKSTVYSCAAIIFIIVYAELLQDVLPSDLSEVKNPCAEFINNELRTPLCTMKAMSLRDVRNIFLCYPYGDLSTTSLTSSTSEPEL